MLFKLLQLPKVAETPTYDLDFDLRKLAMNSFILLFVEDITSNNDFVSW